tara:strand:+ start:1423 stop:1659 length:237 start_codon:yes stop_codon:yes gene_type:complete
MKISKNDIKQALLKHNQATKIIIKDAEINYFMGLESIFVKFDFKFLNGVLRNKLIFFRMYLNENKITHIKYMGSKYYK